VTSTPFKQTLWRVLGHRIFACTPHTAHKFRRRLLRAFGATLTGTVKVRRSVRIDRPWNLTAGHLAIFGDHATLRLHEPITVGERCVISQYTTLATEILDPRTGETVAAPITIEDDCWVAADALVLPGATIHAGTVVGSRAMVATDLPNWSIAVGEPARAIKARAFVNTG
jgi:putative colanic acid biosynthesis acetyltransferase WcaF